MNSEEEASIVKYKNKEAKEHEHAQLKVEEGVCLALEAKRRAEEEYLGLNPEETRLKNEADDHARLKAEEEDQISEEEILKVEQCNSARMKVEDEVLLAL